RIVRHLIADRPGVVAPVASGVFPAVDPTGTRLAYLACDGPSGHTDTVVIRSLATGDERRIPVNPAERSWWATPPRWSPDGGHLAMRVVEGPGGGSPLRVLDAQSGASLAASPVVWFSDAADIFGYLGATGSLLGATDMPAHRARVVEMDPLTG